MKRKTIQQQNYLKLIIVSGTIGILSSVLAFSLKHLTEYFEHHIFESVNGFSPYLLIILPTVGITSIYFLRKYLFKNKKNKGITEIYKTLDQRKDHLPFYKIPSHYINGFLTVVFGGSTGIEVSTVVSTAAIGNWAYLKNFSAKLYKKELICAGVAAGVAILFSNPFAGWLFAMEVIARKMSKTLLISCTVASLIAWAFIYFLKEPKVFDFEVINWNFNAMPFFILLSFLGGLLAVYFTILVVRMKSFFSNISNNFLRVNTGALITGLLIFTFPALYGDSYHGLKEIIGQIINNQTAPILLLIFLLLLKPLAAAFTLGAGGDGGVFAPSIVAGAFLGLMLANFCNHFLGTDLIPLNFAIVGAAATLSGALFAPFTSFILICGLFPNGYELFFPVLMSCFLAKIFSKKLLPYNVYTYDFYLASKV